MNPIEVTLTLPEEVAANIQVGSSSSLARRILELAAIQAHEAGIITETEVMETLGFDDREELYQFLKSYDVRSTHIDLQTSSETLEDLLSRQTR